MRLLRKLFPRPGFSFLIVMITAAATIFFCFRLPDRQLEHIARKTFIPTLVHLRGELPTRTDIAVVDWSAPQKFRAGVFPIETPPEVSNLEAPSAAWWKKHAIYSAMRSGPRLYVGGNRWIGNPGSVPQAMGDDPLYARPHFRLEDDFPNSANTAGRPAAEGEGTLWNPKRRDEIPIQFYAQPFIYTAVGFQVDSDVKPIWAPNLLVEALRVHDGLPPRSLHRVGDQLILGKRHMPIALTQEEFWFEEPRHEMTRGDGSPYYRYSAGHYPALSSPWKFFFLQPLSSANPYRSFGAYDLAAGKIPPSEISGLIIAEFGVQELDAIFQNRFLRPWPYFNQLCYILLTGLVAAILLPRMRGLRAATFASVGSIALFLAPVICLRWNGSVFPAFTPASIWASSGVLGILVAFTESKKARDTIKKLFGRYLSRQVMDAVLKSPDLMKLDGREEVLTVLVSDIRGFTTFSETFPASKVAEMLNEYFDEMIAAAFRNGGTLDKLIGDAIVVYFGNPIPAPDHADRAVRTAIEMKAALRKLCESWSKRGLPKLECGIGIHTGNVFVGNVGSDSFQSYTVIGANVQEAYILQTAAKRGEVLISGATRNVLTDNFKLKERSISSEFDTAFEVVV